MGLEGHARKLQRMSSKRTAAKIQSAYNLATGTQWFGYLILAGWAIGRIFSWTPGTQDVEALGDGAFGLLGATVLVAGELGRVFWAAAAALQAQGPPNPRSL